VAKAVELVQEGTDTLDAAVEGVKIVELDPNDDSVGYDALRNGVRDEETAIRLDASCMHGPTRRAGAVAALQRIRTPSDVARLVLRDTDHVLLVGEGARQFALSRGFKEEDVLTSTGTINLQVVDARGDISSVTTTSGLGWKIPGGAGAIPIVGAGQYTDNGIGAAGSTGRGESSMMVCGGFLTVEGMRRGLAPADACRETLRRVVATMPAQLLDERGRPKFDLSFYAVNKRGEFGAASLYAGRYAVHDGREAALRDTAYLYERDTK
jgi:N4-(beta-N-acetylglucosaminyl)-L-asparaginase